VRLAKYVRQHGDLQLGRFIRRLRGKGCRRSPARVVLFDVPGSGTPPNLRVRVVSGSAGIDVSASARTCGFPND
jgi:hypothetical protein